MRRGALGVLRAHRARRRMRERAAVSEESMALGLDDAVREFAWSYVTETLIRYRGDRKRTAAALGISLRTLYRYLASSDKPRS